MLDIARDVALRSPAELQRLVEAVVAAEPNDESRSVEWKGTLDLSHRDGAFAVARCILGLANRYPPQVENDFGGLGYMVVGAEPGNLAGLTPIDPVDLDNKMSQYLGTRHPQWSPQYITVDGKQVLVVLVEPPQWGDFIWLLRKEWSDGKRVVPVGTVFVRGTAKTAPATDADFDKLQERIVRRVVEAPSLDLDVSVTAPPLIRVVADDETVASWLTEHERMLLDHSSRASYRYRVSSHMTELSERLVDVFFSRLISRDDPAYVVMVQNPSLKNYPNVEMVLRCSDGTKMWAFADPDELHDEFPSPPALGLGLEVPAYLPVMPTIPALSTGVEIELGDDEPPIITLRMNDVRPRGKATSEPFYLFVDANAGETVTFQYVLTSTRVDAIAEGVITVNVSDRLVNLRDVVAVAENMPSQR
ncbi:hypothetical protein ACI799_07635 [Blastococcus sp. SYSU DS0753]